MADGAEAEAGWPAVASPPVSLAKSIALTDRLDTIVVLPEVLTETEPLAAMSSSVMRALSSDSLPASLEIEPEYAKRLNGNSTSWPTQLNSRPAEAPAIVAVPSTLPSRLNVPVNFASTGRDLRSIATVPGAPASRSSKAILPPKPTSSPFQFVVPETLTGWVISVNSARASSAVNRPAPGPANSA